MRRSRPVLVAITAALAALCATQSALAAPHVSLNARFAPDLLDQSATLLYEISISQPIPVESVDLRIPRGSKLVGSSLGLSECLPLAVLEDEGPEACPANSIVGRGTAVGGIQLTSDPPRLVKAQANVLLAYGPVELESGNPTILILVEATEPYDLILVTSQLEPVPPPYSYSLDIKVPLEQAWTEGPDIALLHLKATIGPRGITYRRREHDKIFTFKPRGLTTPSRCPPKGFPFEARFRFYDGTTAVARDRAPCPASST
jgi:hypothetical protein